MPTFINSSVNCRYMIIRSFDFSVQFGYEMIAIESAQASRDVPEMFP